MALVANSKLRKVTDLQLLLSDCKGKAVARWIRTDCGRVKHLELAVRPGLLPRLAWFDLIAALRDLPLAGGVAAGTGEPCSGRTATMGPFPPW